MAKIHGIVYLLIGGIVAFISNRLNQNDSEFSLFYWIGIAFLVIGTFKTILWIIMKKDGRSASKKEHYPSLEPEMPRKSMETGKNIHNKECKYCRLQFKPESNFCSRCGRPLR